MGVALLAAWLGLGTTVQAQYPPGPGGGPSLEPMPSAPSTIAADGPGKGPPPKPLAPVVPGPMPAWFAPQGPPPELSLPNDGTGAFPCEITPPESAWYAHFGAVGIERQNPGTNPTAVYDRFAFRLPVSPSAATMTDSIAQRYSQVPMTMNWGPKATIGYLLGDEAIELTAFYVFQSNPTVDTFSPRGVDTLFYNAPPGFGGDSHRFLQNDQVSTTISTTLLNTEINYRFWDPAYAGWEGIVGVRYFDIKDGAQISSFANSLMGNNVPQSAEIYTTRARNFMVLPQVGLEYFYAPVKWFQMGMVGKGSWGPNIINTVVSLNRGDGATAFDTHTNKITFGQVYELGIYMDLNPHPRIHFRGGVNAYWATGIATGPDQVDYNLQNTAGAQKTNGSLLFWGPQLELQFLF